MSIQSIHNEIQGLRAATAGDMNMTPPERDYFRRITKILDVLDKAVVDLDGRVETLEKNQIG